MRQPEQIRRDRGVVAARGWERADEGLSPADVGLQFGKLKQLWRWVVAGVAPQWECAWCCRMSNLKTVKTVKLCAYFTTVFLIKNQVWDGFGSRFLYGMAGKGLAETERGRSRWLSTG